MTPDGDVALYQSPDEKPPGGTRVRVGGFVGDMSFDFSPLLLEFELAVPFCMAGPFFCVSDT